MNQYYKIKLNFFDFSLKTEFFIKIFKILLFLLLVITIYTNNKILFLFSNNSKSLKVCICAIGKNENFYIQEFINYYKEIGYNKIILYDNNDIDDERFDNIIKNDIDNGFVSIINYRGMRGMNINPQLKAYKDCYEKYNLKYDWLSFFDIDEYLELIPKSLNIQSFLNNEKFINCQNIKINWVYYINNNSLYYENKSLIERVNIPNFNLPVNYLIKSTVRGKLPINYWSLAENPHTSLNKFNTCSSSGKIIDYKSPYNKPPEFKFAFLKHLQYKSFEEYCLKIKRGRPIQQYQSYREDKIKQLFESNKNNTEKLSILIKIFNSSKIIKIHQK